MRKSIKCILMAIILCILGYSLYRAYDLFSVRKEASDSLAEISQYAQVKEDTDETSVSEEKELVRAIDVDFDSLIEQNSDFFGWLYLPNDDIINYPVCQGEDNVYYLTHLFDGKKNANGTLFLDYRNVKGTCMEEFSDNSIIYGHTMKNKKMFHALGSFKKQDYYEEHPYFYLELPEHEYRLDVFACYVCPAVSDAYTLEFNKPEGVIIDADGNEQIAYKYSEAVLTFDEWYKDVMEKNLLTTNVEVEEGDKIFTFSACDYSFNNARVVVHCKVVDTNA